MPQIDKHLEWCLKDGKRLVKVRPDTGLAQKHIKKSEHNFGVLQDLENMKRYDWALNVGFYAIYHCFLALLAKHGYESRNQSCTITVLLALIDEKKLEFDKDLVLQFDTLDPGKDAADPTVRESRETSTYGVETSIDLQQLKRIKGLILKVQRETIKILGQG
ncbi:MAG: HEPN domain-containing protein [Candidatus Woesearchaeota archaeon]